MLLLIKDMTLAMRGRIIDAIQRYFRLSLGKRKEASALIIQCAYRSSTARHKVKTERALRFLRRLQHQGLLRCLHLWQNETKLAIFTRKKIGEKGQAFDAWFEFYSLIKSFKERNLKNRTRLYCTPCVKAWWLYVAKVRRIPDSCIKFLQGKSVTALVAVYVSALLIAVPGESNVGSDVRMRAGSCSF